MGWKDLLSESELRELSESPEESHLAGLCAQVLVTTGDLKTDYEIVDCVFSLGSDTGVLANIISANPAAAFHRAKEVLKAEALKLECDAVVSCQFEYRVAVNDGLIGTNQVMEIFAYGTAVRRAGFTFEKPQRSYIDAAPSAPARPERVGRLPAGKVLIAAGLPQYIKLFSEKGIRPEDVPHLTLMDLMTMGIRDDKHCQRIMAVIASEMETP